MGLAGERGELVGQGDGELQGVQAGKILAAQLYHSWYKNSA